MHVISGLKKRLAPKMLGAATATEAPAIPAANRPTTTEMREEEIHVGMEQTRLTYSYNYRNKKTVATAKLTEFVGRCFQID